MSNDMQAGAALSALDAVVPAPVREACAQLVRAGHEAYAVGGAVRDALLGRKPGDWDVATSATPDQVTDLFDKTIPTGIQHGTVTVLVGRGASRTAIEVTTFRGEGAYTDSRHPDTVTFGVPLHEDLARRDFVINAMAYDPVARVLADPFGGQDDLVQRRVRAVGQASQRFAEDGLRVMRAVRLAAVLDFELDPETEAAIPGALGSLARVSSERVRDELLKLLAAPAPSRGLVSARRTGVLALILPELDFGPGSPAAGDDTRWQRTLARVDALERDAILRLAALLWDMPDATQLDAALRRLKLSNAERMQIAALLGQVAAWPQAVDTAATLRRMLGQVGRARAPELVALWQAESKARAGTAEASQLEALCARARAVLQAGDALVVGELALTGGEVMRLLQLPPSRLVGRVLDALLGRVLAEPALNTAEQLGALLPEIHAALAQSDAANGPST